jgi:hypothetical protein
MLHIRHVGPDTKLAPSTFRLLIGKNAPEVLTGTAQPTGRPLIHAPIEVQVGIQVDQITEINQREENFSTVASLLMRWQDSAFVFNPKSCMCAQKVFTREQFEQLGTEHGLLWWPDFVFRNQQGRRWSQRELFSVTPNGEVTYFERFTVTLQAPDFDFLRFPFDPQQFFIRLVSLPSDEQYVYTDDPEFTAVGDQLGEEEWRIVAFDTSIDRLSFGLRQSHSQFSLRLVARRHLSYYLFRIFLPLILIILVSWFTLFMKDYGRRVDVSAANLLTFVAFNFTIGSDLPRLGYLTFLDSFLVLAFVTTVLTVLWNVALKRLDASGRDRLLRRLDLLTIWGYPVVYLVGLGLIMAVFFL